MYWCKVNPATVAGEKKRGKNRREGKIGSAVFAVAGFTVVGGIL